MSLFLPAFEVVMQHEVDPSFTLATMDQWADKGFVHDLRTGEVNKWGFTLATLRDMGYQGTKGSGPPTESEIALVRGLTPDTIRDLYLKHFWQHFLSPGRKGEMLVDMEDIREQIAADKLFDMMIHHGIDGAVRLTQSVLKRWTLNLKIDGILGPMTVEAINQAPRFQRYPNSGTLIPELCRAYRALLLSIIQANPEDAPFKANWEQRAIWPYQKLSDIPGAVISSGE